MSDPTPVPLTDIEAAAGEATPGPWTTPDVSAVWGGDGWVLTDASYEDAAHIAAADPPTVLALCDALRIAVEALDTAHEALACAGVVYSAVYAGSISDADGWAGIENALRGPPPEGSIISYDTASALARIRELVDLGEKP